MILPITLNRHKYYYFCRRHPSPIMSILKSIINIPRLSLRRLVFGLASCINLITSRVGYHIGIAGLFVLQLPKIELRTPPYLYNRKKWIVWDDLNPQPRVSTDYVKGQMMKENLLKFHPVDLFFLHIPLGCIPSTEVLKRS
jgi:hypothetical protein